MRPVNLLPEQHRPLVPTGRRAGSSYVVLGVLIVVLVGVVAYAVTASQVNSRKAQTIDVKREAAEAEARAAVLAPFANFKEIKDTRVQSVTQLAQGRIDWERLSRELAHVLPSGSWLTNLDASTLPAEASGGATEEAAAGGPSVVLTGCAESQPVVARLMVRLRRLDRAQDVELQRSGREGGGGAAADAGGAAAAGGGCGELYAFDITVELTAPPTTPVAPTGAPEASEVPASLGGGP